MLPGKNNIDQIKWTVSGNVDDVFRAGGTRPNLHFSYNVNGERLVKQVKGKNSSGDYTVDGFTKTYYIRDAEGNILATYKKQFGLNDDVHRIETLEVGEFMFYGSDRVGTYNDTITIMERDVLASISNGEVSITDPSNTYHATLDPNRSQHLKGRRQYEVKNHLGNVLATVSDDRIPHDDNSDNTIDYYTPMVTSAQDYYPFGALMPGRQMNATDHQFGFNEKLKEDDLKGIGNSYDFDNRMDDPGVSRFVSLDRLASKYPSQSPYSFAANMPLVAIDAQGDSVELVIGRPYKKGGEEHLYAHVVLRVFNAKKIMIMFLILDVMEM